MCTASDVHSDIIYAIVVYYMRVPLLQQKRKIYDTPAV